ncbi:MAG: cellulase family glycosylhydrolase [Herpetosiphon sp.]
MPRYKSHLSLARCLLVVVPLLAVAFGLPTARALEAPSNAVINVARLQAVSTLFLPLVQRAAPASRLGYQASFGDDNVTARARELGPRMVRLQGLHWRLVQPNRGDPFNWSAMAELERDLVQATQLNLTPEVIVYDSPRWATVNETSCSAIRDDRLADFATFMRAAVARYAAPPFNAHLWELGNEPDVDPTLVGVDSEFGCWGDIRDPYYGGERYGRMLQSVTPTIRNADPAAKVMIGGLLLYSPVPEPNRGRPDLFLQGILKSGAAPFFDIVAYHAYPNYTGQALDEDQTGDWQSSGGRVVGKATYLRNIMNAYNVAKPLYMNETSLICRNVGPPCLPTRPAFLEAQANFALRALTRGMSAGLDQILWYTLNGPGWNASSLVDENQTPRPSFRAYKQLSTELLGASRDTNFQNPYGSSVEAYRFSTPTTIIDVAWSLNMTPQTLSIPVSQFRRALDRDGNPITTVPIADQMLVTVPFAGAYIERTP